MQGTAGEPQHVCLNDNTIHSYIPIFLSAGAVVSP